MADQRSDHRQALASAHGNAGKTVTKAVDPEVIEVHNTFRGE